MKKEDFADTLNNVKDLTLGQLFSLVARLKYKTVAMILVFVMSTLGGAFAAGKYTQSKGTAIMMNKPFAMRVEFDGQAHDFKALTLMRDPNGPLLFGNKVILYLREIKSPFDIIPVGQVVATVEENKITGLWHVIISKSDMGQFLNEANAKNTMEFIWNGHEQDYDFKEEFVTNTTIHRYYSDGCILAYNIDNNKRSNPSSFRWVEKTH